jgi:aminoglycoside phosphotransferase (APT) family kinase protein
MRHIFGPPLRQVAGQDCRLSEPTNPSIEVSASPIAPRSEDRVDASALDRWMTENVAGYAGPAAVVKFPSGQSNPTYRVDAESGTYVLRRKPHGALLPSAHAVDREYRLLTALHPTGFPVPRPLALCTDSRILGTEFYAMDMVAGRSFWDGALPDSSPVQRRSVYEALIDTLARLHSIDPSAVGLGDYGRPGNYFERQVRRWTAQYRASQTEFIDEAERLIAWLPQTLPTQDRLSIVHGDYRIDNVLYAVDEPRVLAVIDWELSTTGDPLADLSYLLMNWETPYDGSAGIANLDLEALGIPTLAQMANRYAAATNRSAVPNLNWHFAFNLFRLMAIVQGIRKRVVEGNASSTQAEAVGRRVRPLAAQAWTWALRTGVI